MVQSRVQIFPLFRKLSVSTDGTAGVKLFRDLDVRGLANALVHAEAVFLLGLTEGNVPSAVDWNVAFLSGFDRESQGSAIDISTASPFGTLGSQRSTDYTSTQNFHLDSRLQLWWANRAGVSGVKMPVLSAALGVRHFGS